jgi:hypothetical protein
MFGFDIHAAINKKVSAEMCEFLGVPKGTLISRSNVTTMIIEYAKEHNLMEKSVITVDKKLGSLLRLPESEKVRILYIQRYLRPHFTVCDSNDTNSDMETS